MQTKLRNLILLLAFLCVGLMLCPAVDAEAPDFPSSCPSTYDVALNSSLTGYITPDDKDVFRITVPSAGTLTIYSSSAIPMDPKAVLGNSSCTKIASHDDIDKKGPNYNFRIVKDVPAGTYYVAVMHESNKGQGNYRLHVDFDGGVSHNISASAGVGGSISPAGTINVPDNGSQMFTITPDACYKVTEVVVDGSSVGAVASYIFSNVTADHSISASFESIGTPSITASAGAGGTISPSGAVSVACGADQPFSITPDAGYEVLDVKVDGVSLGAITSHTFSSVSRDHTIDATFSAVGQYTIDTIPGANGTIAPAGPVSVPLDGIQMFAIVPDAGYQVDEVWVDGVSLGAVSSHTFSAVAADHTIEAHFTTASPPPAPADCVDISDIPLDVRFRSAPANIMFVLDDSGSMDWEFITPEADGLFEGFRYVFDNPGDNVYSDSYILGEDDSDDRRKWKSQWAGYNKMYYNPQTVYEPWPNKPPADTTTPRSHPHHATPTFDLTAEYFQITGNTSVTVDDGDSGFNFIAGAWIPGDPVAALSAYDNDFMQSIYMNELKIARWAPNLSPGNYDVYARWIENEWNSNAAEYHVYPDGTAPPTIVPVDQTQGGGTWGNQGTSNYLGNFDFSAAGYVELFLPNTKASARMVSADAVKFEPASLSVSVTRAHYYTWHDADENGVLDSGETVYLVNFIDNNSDGSLDGRQWYTFSDTGDGIVQGVELKAIPEASVPAVVRPNAFADDLQNFANWYSFYRRRELTATAAVAGVIAQAGGMQIGLHSIHNRVIQPVRKILVDGVDESNILLDALYNDYNASGGTPLREGLLNTGKYFDKTDSGDTGGIGASPYAATADGGDCQQAFAILMTDGYYNGDEPWSSAKNVDGNNGAPYADSYENTLADVAMYYYERDLATGLANLVPTNERDDATHQHMVTYSVGFGVHGTLNPADYDFAGGTYPTWPDPGPSDADHEKIDDMWHAAVNGRGRFLTASDAVDLINDLLMVLKDIEIFSGSASSVSVNGDELYMKMNNDVLLFQSKYYSENWHGDVLAYNVHPVTGEVIEPAIWSAAYNLSNQAADHRKIATYDGSSGGKPFRYDHLTDYQKTMLDANWPSDDTPARALLDYLRGDSANEEDNGGSFRNRTWSIVDPSHPHNGSIISSSKMGDIVHSSPVFKNGVLYSGGNEGMLHAIDSETGEELFAYVPNLVFEGLPELTDPAYTHKYYVDLTPTVEAVELGSLTRLLVGGLGHGGRGYYALDVSNVSPADSMVPANENQVAAMVMWEYPNLTTPVGETADLGYSFSRVTIAETNDAGAPWVVIFGNGYNSPNGHAVLFILDPVTGQLIRRIDPQAGQSPTCNGLSTPIATDVDYDGKVDYVYAGDLNGHMWKFDLTDSNHANWDVAFYDGATPKPLFTTANQPITTKPNVMYHCDNDGYMVVFGTGRYLGDYDLSDTSPQALYGVWDYGDDADDTEYVGTISGSNLSDTQLNSPPVTFLAQAVDPTPIIAFGSEFRTISDNQADWRVTTEDNGTCGENDGLASCDLNGIGEHADPLRNVGWVLNLDGIGERVVSDVLVRDGLVIATSYVPEGSICGTGGSSWVWSLNACSGSRLSEAHFDANGDGAVDDNDLINIGPVDDPIWVPPTGKKFDGRLQPPAIIMLNSQVEILYMSSSRGRIETLREKSAKLGLTFWRVFRP